MTSAQQASTPELRAHGIASARWHLVLAAATAVPLGLAFPRVGAGWLAHVALVPLGVLALRSTRPRRLIWTSYLVALAWWLVMLSWLMQVTFGGYLGLCAFLALYTPAFALTFRLLVRRWRIAALLALPLAWVSFEFIGGLTPAGGFGWFGLGDSQAPFAPGHGVGRLIQIADLFGAHGVSFLVAMTNGFIVDLLTRPLVAETAAGGRTRKPLLVWSALWLATLVGAWSYGQWRINSSYGLDPVKSITVAVVQTNVPQSTKDSVQPEEIDQTWADLIDLVVQASQGEPKPDLIVCPETMVPAALNTEALAYYRTAPTGVRGFERYERELRDLARKLRTHLLMGASAKYDWHEVATVDDTGGELIFLLPQRRFNSAFLFAPGSEARLPRYDKIHRVPFGEYVPWLDGWPWLKRKFVRYLTPYQTDYSLRRGVAYTVFKVPTGDDPAPIRLASPICFEDAVPRVVRRMVYDQQGGKRADLLVNLTNDGWFAGSAQGPQHLQIAVLRCIENRVPTARSVNTGVSGFIDSVGRVTKLVTVAGSSQQVQGYATQTLTTDPRATFFGRFGLAPIVMLTGVTGLLIVVGVIRKAD